MIPGDDLAFEAFLAEHTTAISGEADGAVKLPKIPHQTLSLVGMDVSGAWEFNVAPEDGAGSFGLGLRRVKSEDWGVISKHERELRMRHLEQLAHSSFLFAIMAFHSMNHEGQMDSQPDRR